MKTLEGRLLWIDLLKGIAILGILLNHFTEEFIPGFGFSYPFSNFLELSPGNQSIIQTLQAVLFLIFHFLAWIGDQGPGIFILISGLVLTYSTHSKNNGIIKFQSFYQRKILRIFPIYIFIHLLVIAGFLLIPETGFDWNITNVFLSLLGLRVSDNLFFYINPSWWFIWLIVQLYILYPFLFILQQKIGIIKFLVITILFTFLCRLSGLLNFMYSDNLYFWMTGIFFGTRLAEFTLGMSLGVILWQRRNIDNFGLKTTQVFIFSTVILILGIVFTTNYYLLLFSNLFLTVGLTGVYYSLCRVLIKKRLNPILYGLSWFGIYSYGIYLLHQAPLKWAVANFSGRDQLFFALIILILSVPISWIIELFVKFLSEKLNDVNFKNFIKLFILSAIALVFIGLFFFDPQILDPHLRIIFDLLLILSLFLLVFTTFKYAKNATNNYFKLFSYSVILLLIISILFFPPGYYNLAIAVSSCTFLFSILYFRLKSNINISLILGALSTIFLFAIVELILLKKQPLESSRWGEYPAIDTHPTRIYGLKPKSITRLKYNNYDYILRTNSFGLASPEINSKKSTIDTYRILIVGDAFSMPEGLEYLDAFPSLLEKKLKNKYPHRIIQVINAGITGYGPVEQSVQLKELNVVLKPDLVIYQYFINEVLQASQEDRSEKLHSIGFRNPPYNLKDWISEISQIAIRYKMFRNDLIAKAKGSEPSWKYKKSLLGFYELNNDYLYNSENIMKLNFYLKQMTENCAQNDAEFFIAFVPGQVAVSDRNDIFYFPKDQDIGNPEKFNLDLPFNTLSKITDDLNIDVYDLTPILKAYPDQPVYFKKSWHWNKDGHKAVSQYLSMLICEKRYLD